MDCQLLKILKASFETIPLIRLTSLIGRDTLLSSRTNPRYSVLIIQIILFACIFLNYEVLGNYSILNRSQMAM